MKRIIALILAMVMTLSLMPFSMFTATAATVEFVHDGIIYRLSNDRTYYIVAEGMPDITSAVIISEYEGIPVTSIGGIWLSHQLNKCRNPQFSSKYR